MKKTICFGELLLRLSPLDQLRVVQALPGNLEAAFAGAEANMAVAIALLGGVTGLVSALPVNAVGDAAVAVLRAADVCVGDIVRSAAGPIAARTRRIFAPRTIVINRAIGCSQFACDLRIRTSPL